MCIVLGILILALLAYIVYLYASYYRIEVKDSEERLIAVVNTTGYKTAR